MERFTPEQIEAMRDKPLAVARKILGPGASEAAIEASSKMVKVLGDAFHQAGPGGRVGLETQGTGAGRDVFVYKAGTDAKEA